tara:strand:- start:429 stop:1412 length:984 start_codon:yes stop_codon:yes gene_type:complete
MKIGVVIINWNGLNLLKSHLKTVIDYSENCTIYVIDNFSSDQSISYIEENYRDVKVISLDKNYGFAEGYNLGLKEVKEEFICILNNDIQVSKDWLKPIRQKLHKDPESIIQPIIRDINNTNYFEYAGAAGGFIDKYGYPFCRGRIFNTIEKDKNQYVDSEIFWASGACMVLSKDTFNKIGGFDEKFYAHMEEIDMCWRGFNLGYKCFLVSESKVFHVGAATIKRNSNKTYLNYRNSLIMLTKNLPIETLIITIFFRLILDMISSFRMLLSGNFSHFISIYKAHVDYFIMLKSLLRSRDNSHKNANYFKINSIVINYFLLGKKKFFQL